ncbi:MAG: cyclic nucleotide-binding domain-containing protein [Betaproteobacteria bacterium]|nr:MAG: cyclic nucleotide-binding domain-containing protein [Betaproteobacteria bacterium]
MITAEQLKTVPLLAGVPERELAVIASRAADVYLRPNDWLIQEGEVPAFFILLSGKLTVSKYVGGIERVINTYRPGDHAGEVPLLLGSPAIASLRAAEATRVCRLEPEDFRELIAACAQLNAELMRTMATRIGHLQQVTAETPIATVKLIGHRFDLACHALRDFLARNRVSFRWHDIHDPEARIGLAPTPQPTEAYPVVVLPDGERLTTPTFRTVAERLGLQTDPSNGRYDVAIVGAGPAGLAAAVYGASEGLRTLLIERHAPGGQAGTSSRIENYLGFPTGVAGDDLGNRALQQAKRFGAEIIVAREVVGIAADPTLSKRAIQLDGDNRIETQTIIVANGVSWRKLEVVGAEALVGRGIYYGAARTEAAGTRGLDIFLIGGGNSAGQAAMFFTDYARTVTILIRGASLAASMSHYLIEQLARKSNVKVEAMSQVVALEGTEHLEAIVIEDRQSGTRRRAATQALFVFIGADAETAWLPPTVICDQRGYVCTGRDVLDLVAQRYGSWPLKRDPFLLETSVPGIFAAGDVRHGSIKRVASGVGEGSMAIAFIHQYLAEAAYAR